MADSALEATERQFISLLGAASDSFSIQLSLFALPGIPRGEVALRRIHERYVSTELLDELKLDGLIVTGREPLTPNLGRAVLGQFRSGFGICPREHIFDDLVVPRSPCSRFAYGWDQTREER